MFYNCEEKWTLEHRYKPKFLCMTAAVENCETEEEYQISEEALVEGDVSNLNSLDGPGAPRSLCVWGNFGHKRAHVLIDSGSTHNFIQPTVAQKLGLRVNHVRKFRVFIDNDDSLLCECVCPNAVMELQGVKYEVDLCVATVRT